MLKSCALSINSDVLILKYVKLSTERLAMLEKFKSRVLLSAPHMTGSELQYINDAFTKNWVMPLGPHVTQFESEVVKFLNDENLYAVAMTSGTAAIHIALKLLGLKENEEVFCSSSTFAATCNPIVYEKAVPVFIDSELKTWNICPESLQKAIEQKKKTGKVPRILIAVDLFGMSANYEEIVAICEHHKIEIIEDSAESLGSNLKNKKCGTFGKFGILSFNGNKIITTSGGGMLITHSKEDAERALFLITQARDKAPFYLHSEIGYNYRLSNISAAIGLGQMTQLNERVLQRRQVYQRYQENLKATPLKFLEEPEGYFSNNWLSTALIPNSAKKTPSELINFLNDYNVETRHIWKPMHTQPVFEKNEFYSVHKYPVSEQIFNEGICLPSCSDMSIETQQKVCEIIQKFFS